MRPITLALLIVPTTAFMASDEFKAPSELPSIEQLPDPFVMRDGSRVADQSNWVKRRSEMRDLLLTYEYGQIPSPAPVTLAESTEPSQVEDNVTLQELVLNIGRDPVLEQKVRVHAPLGLSEPLPVVLRIGLGCPIISEVTNRGYLFVDFDPRELDPDTEGHDIVGPAQAAYPNYDWGSLAVWAWGASRVLDALESLEIADAGRVVVTGHSRMGKAALLAGALDDRFAAVVPNGSGCGGAAAYRISTDGIETLEMITRPSRFQAWFKKEFRQFAGKEDKLPFDQHFLRALVAPRPLLTTEARGDLWANPKGNQAAYMAGEIVYEWLGAADKHAMHFRDGQHDQLAEDFRILLDFADKHLKGRDVSREFTVLPHPEYEPEFSWEAP